jgi:GNAT superfamily N-acetyltransferase
MGFENHYQKDTTKLHRIYLLEEAKGKGVGKFAINFLKNQAKESGDQRIILPLTNKIRLIIFTLHKVSKYMKKAFSKSEMDT